jgi:transcriptional regulator with XRE-family HTH domain
MDMQKIGTFLAELRKEKNLTQDELGAQIGVTNKTVSRWETGSYLPPVEMLQTLGDTFGVSINEILNGERISDGNYKDISEQNIKSALTKSDSVIAKHRKIMNWVIAVVVAALYVTISLITLKWEYTWIIWAVYCAYRTVESIIIYRLNVHINSK